MARRCRPRRAAGAHVLAPAFALVAVLTLALGGCATAPPPLPAAGGASGDPATLHREHLAAATAVATYRLRGRIAVQRGDKGFSADLDWRQGADSFVLRVAAPLSGGTFSLNGGSAGVTVITPKGESDSAADPETLMLRHLGWSMPLAGARWWVRGLPDPGRPAAQERLDDAGRWTDFAQDGWRVSLLEYTDAHGVALPRRLFLARGDLQVRMAVNQWEHPLK